jgi:hypothetical protein
MAEHTPTPWSAHERLDETGGTLIVRRSTGSEDDYHIADCSVQFSGQNTGKNAANAAFIVKAVNNHKNLVFVIEQILGLSRGTSGRIIIDLDDEAIILQALEKAKV